jgi:hypothetical protein
LRKADIRPDIDPALKDAAAGWFESLKADPDAELREPK